MNTHDKMKKALVEIAQAQQETNQEELRRRFWTAHQAIIEGVECMAASNLHRVSMGEALWAIAWIANVEGLHSFSALFKLLENHGFCS